MQLIEIDVVLQGSEDGEKIAHELSQRFGVVAEISPVQDNSSCTLNVTGEHDALDRVQRWHRGQS